MSEIIPPLGLVAPAAVCWTAPCVPRLGRARTENENLQLAATPSRPWAIIRRFATQGAGQGTNFALFRCTEQAPVYACGAPLRNEHHLNATYDTNRDGAAEMIATFNL